MFPLHDNIRTRSFPWMVLLLIGINAYIFWQELLLSPAGLTRFVAQYGLTPRSFLAALDYQPHSLATYQPLLSNLFLHGGWLHIIGNMWYLWVFGKNVEDRLGHGTFVVFYLLAGVAANLTQIAMNPYATVPTIGASGAISGVLGAYFVSFPFARVATVIPLFILFPVVEIPALLFLGLWFLLQLQNGTAALAAGAGIAWWAHAGGFVAGMVLCKLLK